MVWRIEISDAPRKILAKLDKQVSARILDFLTQRIAKLENPRSVGEALKGSRFGQLWKYRVGDYRILCQIQDVKLVVLVVRIGHRKNVYE